MSGRLINLDALKEEIAEALSISAVAERLCGVALETAGQQHRGLCPIHGERTPSFYVHDGKGTYHCFGCKAGGDSIDLVRQVRHLEFYEALYLLAAEGDVDIAKYERPLTAEEREREALRAYCEAWLARLDRRPNARTGGAANDRFGVGLSHGFDVPDPPGYLADKDWMAKGAILPYRMPNGRLVGWKVRERPGDEKHMVKTPNDWPLADTTLFGVQVAREHLADYDHEIVVVEGEYDTMACHEAGIANVVGMGGSAFTDEHMALLESLHVRKVCFVLDGDDGGQKAAKAIADKYWDHDVQVRVCHMPEGEDPESFLGQYSDISFVVHAQGARHALEWLLWREWQRRDRISLGDKLDFVSWVHKTYGARLSATKAQLVLAEVANWLDLAQVDVFDFVRSSESELQAVDSERVVLAKAIRDQRYYIEARKLLSADDFYVLKHQRLWQVLETLVTDSLDVDLAIVIQRAEAQAIPADYVRDLAQTGDKNIAHHERQIGDLALRRRARHDADGFRALVADLQVPVDVTIGQFTSDVTAGVLRRNGGAERSIAEQVDKAMAVLHERMANPNEIHGIDLGPQLPNLARALQGLQERRLAVIAANSRRGKSTLMAQIAVELAVGQAVPNDFISLEMDESELLFKMASHITGLDSMLITGGRLDAAQARAVEQAMLRIRNSPLRIHAPDDMCPSEFVLYAREQRMQRRSEVFWFDYVQLAAPEPGREKVSKYEQIGDFSRTAKMQVARAMDCCVVVAAQMKREAADKDRPTAEDVGDSYQIVRDCDWFLIIQGDPDTNTVDLWLDKNRQGAGNLLVPTVYTKETQTFHEASGGEKRPVYSVPIAA